MNRDTAVGIAGAVLLVAAMVVVFAYERDNAQASSAAPVAAHLANAKLTGSVARGASDSKTDHIAQAGPANVTFHLTWTATNGKDTLTITATPPPGSGLKAATSQATDSGSASVTVPIPANQASDGNWTIEVDFAQATPAPLPGGVSPPVGGMTDASASYTVDVKVA